MKRLFSIILILNVFCYKYVEYPIEKNMDNVVNVITDEKKDYLFILEIPKIKLNCKIYNFNDKRNDVDKNVELLKPFKLPPDNNSIVMLAGHNGNLSVSYFRNLYKLKLNDYVILNYKEKKYVYKIVNIYDVEKTGKLVVKRGDCNHILVLITCKGKNKQTVFISSLID